jgi:hypothetical protein
MSSRYTLATLAALSAACGAAADPVKLKVTVENLAPENGAALSPFTVGFHDGSFNPFDAGAAAMPGIQNIAELGDGTDYLSEFAASQPQGVSGVITAMENAFGPGIFLPGGSGSMDFTVDSAANRFFSFGSMVVPSNDRFLGDDSPIELFDAAGNFIGQTITLLGSDIWESVTEEDGHFGAAFIEGQDAMDHIAEDGMIRLNDDFSAYEGVTTPAGYTFSVLPTGGAEIARITFTVVPAPGSAAILMLVGAATASRRRRTL